jgi:hypothetical protein
MNTQEKEPELGEGVTSAEFWMYDGELGRRWNVDPVLKVYESPFSCFGNNPLTVVDILGSDSFNVISKTYNALGGEMKDGDPPLVLFRVFTEGEQKKDMTSDDFIAKYQISAERLSHKINDVEQAKPYAKVLTVYSENEHFRKAIYVTDLKSLNKEYGRLKNLVGDAISFLDKLRYFRQGATGDFKTTTAKKLFTFVEGVGLFQSEDIGNFIYGMILSNSGENSMIGMQNGDALQSSYKLNHSIEYEYRQLKLNTTEKLNAGNVISAVDDVIDSYYIYAGAYVGTYIDDFDLLQVKGEYTFNKTTTYSATEITGTRGGRSKLTPTHSTYDVVRR